MKIIAHFIIPALILAGGFLSFSMLKIPIQELISENDALIQKLEKIKSEQPIIAKQCRIDNFIKSEKNLKSFADNYKMALFNMLVVVTILVIVSSTREIYLLVKSQKNS